MKKMKLKVAVRDGKKLVTFVYLPGDGIERYAGVFLRNPYVEDTAEQEERNENMIRPYVEAGFAVILQHCRGRGGSEGDFIPFAGEREDGLDTIAWIEKQEWFDGRLYLWGGSYLTYVHLSYMDALPACVKGACLAVMAADCRLAFYKGGAFKADLLPPWYTSLYHPGDHPGKDGNACRREYFAPNPLSEFSLRTYGYAAKPLDDLIAGSATGEYGAPGSFSDAADSFKNLQIPVRIIDGWGEMFLGGMEKMWQELPEETRKKSAFVIGPWSHALNTIMPDWKYDFGQNAGIVGSDLGWLLWLRDGKPLGDDMKLGKLNYFHVGKNVWETADDFTYLPRNKTLYLCKDGTLGDARPEDASLSYTFDPRDPASFPGGPNSFATGPQGFAPQPEPDFRPDVKSFLTAPLAKEMTLAGRIGVELDVSSDCEATMFVARVSCVDKAGVATVIQDAVALTGKILPGKPTHLSFETDVLCWTLLPGERLRLDISSADAHSYRVHTNMPGDWFTERESRVAVNTLHLGESCLKLPAED